MGKNYFRANKMLRSALTFSGFSIVWLWILVSPFSSHGQSAATQSSFFSRSFSVACPFFTVFDEISETDFRSLWKSDFTDEALIKTLYITDENLKVLSSRFGKPEGTSVQVVSKGDSMDGLLGTQFSGTCVLVATDELQPNWKRIRIGNSPAPWDREYYPESDPLNIPAATQQQSFDRNRVTSLLLTGTTALSRTVSYKMAQNGIAYPAEKIRAVFEASDLRHISNESSFWSLCPEPQLKVTGMQFCTPAEFISLFTEIGVNIVELTGNHLRDYDWPPLLETLELLESKGIGYYGAGRDFSEAEKPLEINHNGNDFVFLGCNIAGPEHVFVTGQLPGVSRCNFDDLEKQIRLWSDSGRIVVVTLQYYENYSYIPNDQQRIDFQRLSDAGAVVVSGSQAHMPQIMQPMSDRWIHYGLGNLFFDQMDRPVAGTRDEFLDRLIFYNGRLLQVELITAVLEDYSQPRLMTADERETFLTKIFSFVE